jgi:hypothetical protein
LNVIIITEISTLRNFPLKISILFLFTVSFWSLPFNGNSQEFHYKHYDITNGLAGNNVYQSIEDKEGFMWFATETGVSRFDGTTFKNFTTAEGLPDNEILRLFVDNKNRVWMIPFKNAVCYYYKGKIYNAENDSIVRNLKMSDRLLGMSEDGEGNLFFFQALAISVLKPGGRIINKSTVEPQYSIFFGGGTDYRNDPYVFLDSFPTKTRLHKIRVTDTIAFEKINRFIVFHGNKWNYSYINAQLFVYLNNYDNNPDFEHLVFNNYRKRHLDTITLPPKFNLLSFINDSILFFNTGYGAIEYNYQSGTYHTRFLDNENISGTLEDKAGNLWFTTLGNGVFRLRSRKNKSILLVDDKGKGISVESILVTDSKVLVGTDNAKIFEMGKSGKGISPYREIATDIGKVIRITAYDNKAYVLCENRFYKMDPASWKIQPLKITKTVLPIFAMKDVSFGKRSEIFFATHVGIYCYSPLTEKLELYFRSGQQVFVRLIQVLYRNINRFKIYQLAKTGI